MSDAQPIEKIPPQHQEMQPGREAPMRPHPEDEMRAYCGAGQPDEIAPCYIFLASGDSSYITSKVLHPNGGEIVNS